MNRRLLVIEPDPAARALLDRALTSSGYAAEEFEAAAHARILLDDKAYDLALVDELAGGGFLSDVKFLRTHYPALPLIVMGTMLSAPALLDLMRLEVSDALMKPFTPNELREAVARVLERTTADHTAALDYAASVADARDRLAHGEPERSARQLARAWSHSPLDAEVMALESLRAEFEGRDSDAAHGYRAALALRHDEDTVPPDPHDGLARLAAYGRARPVDSLDASFASAPRLIVTDANDVSPSARIEGIDGLVVIVFSIALTDVTGAVPHLRQARDRAFVVLPTSFQLEFVAPILAASGTGPLLASPSTRAANLDLARLASLCEQARERPAYKRAR